LLDFHRFPEISGNQKSKFGFTGISHHFFSGAGGKTKYFNVHCFGWLGVSRYGGEIDLALLHFSNPFKLTDKVKVAKLPEKLVNNEGKFVMVGVGTIPKDDPKIPGGPPRKAAVQGLSDENCVVECNKIDGCANDDIDPGDPADDYICGKKENSTLIASCDGDSGGWFVVLMSVQISRDLASLLCINFE